MAGAYQRENATVGLSVGKASPQSNNTPITADFIKKLRGTDTAAKSAPITADWLRNNQDAVKNFVINVEKSRFDNFRTGLESLNEWQPAEKVDAVIRQGEQLYKDGLWQLTSSEYDNVMSTLKQTRDNYGKYSSLDEYQNAVGPSIEEQYESLAKDILEKESRVAHLERQLELLTPEYVNEYENRRHEARATRDKVIAEKTAEYKAAGHSDENAELMANNFYIRNYSGNAAQMYSMPDLNPDTMDNPAAERSKMQKELETKKAEINVSKRTQALREMIINATGDKNFKSFAVVDYGEENDPTYKYLNNINGFKTEQDKYWLLNNTYQTDQGVVYETAKPLYMTSNYHQLKADELLLYNYYHKKYGKKEADRYLSLMQETLNAREAGEIAEGVGDSAVMRTLFSAYAGVDNFKTGLENLFNGSDYIVPNETQLASAQIRENLSGFSQTMYDLVNTSANMLPSILTSAAIGSVSKTAGAVVGNVLMGSSSAGHAYAEMLNRGFSKEQARNYGLLVGGSEAGLSYLLGGFGKLGGKHSLSSALGSVSSKINSGLAKWVLSTGGNMLSEFTEEALQETLTSFYKNVAVGADIEEIDWEQVFYGGVLGALSAGLLEGGPALANGAANTVRTYRQGKALIADGVEVAGLKKVGESMPADTVAHKIASKVNENTGAYKIAKLFNAVGAELTAQNQADISRTLQRKGALKEDADEISQYLAAAVNGAEFTDKQIKALELNPVIAETMRDVLINSNSSVNTRMQNARATMFGLDGKAPLATDAETRYTDNVQGDGTRYSLNGEVESTADYDALERYDSRTYANRGWVTVNRVLTGNELKKLNSQWADAVKNGFKYPTTPSGETIITVGDAYGDADKLVYISGTLENPIISKVVQIKPSDPGDISVIREMFIKGEQAGDVDSRGIIESAFGQGIFLDKLPGDYAGYRELQNQRAEQTSNPVGNGDHQQRSNGGRSGAANLAGDRGAVNNTGITDNSLPSNDGTGRDSYTQNAENPQQFAVGLDSRAQIYEVERILQRHVAEGEAAADNEDNLATVAPAIEEDPSLTKEQRRAKIESDLRESAKEHGVADDVTDAIAYIAGRTGTHVLFVEQVYTKNGTPADGVCFPSNNVILISKNAKAPVYEVVRHELAHSIAGTKLYGKLVDFVKQTPQIQQVLRKNGMEFEELVEAKIRERAVAGETLNYDGAVEEIVADYVAQYLLTDQTRITELFKAQQNVFYKFLYNIRNWMKNVNAPNDLRLLRQAEQRYVKALAQKGKRYYKSKYDTTAETSAEGKYSIDPGFAKSIDSWDKQKTGFRFRLGTVSEPLQSIGVDPKEIYWDSSKIKRVLNEHPQMTVNVVKQVPNILESPVIIMESNTVNGRLTLFGEVYDAAGSPVLAVLELSPKDKNGRDLDIVMVASAYGKEGNLQNYINKSRVLYVDPNKNRTNKWLTVNRLQLPLPSTIVGSSDTTISQNNTDVNTQYMQEDGKYSVGTDEDFVTSLNRMVEQYGKHAPGANAERTVAIPQSTGGQNRVARAARTIGESTEVTPDWFLPQYQKQVLTDAFSYKPKTNRSELAFANDKLEELGFDGALEYWRSKQVEGGSAGGNVQALGVVLLHEAARRKNVAALMELNTGIAADALHAGQSAQAITLIKNATPEGRVYVLKKLVDRMNTDNDSRHRSAEKRQRADAVYRRISEAQKRGADQSVIEALQKELNAIDGSLFLPEACVRDILSQTTPEGLDAAVDRALIEVAKQKSATWLQKWNQWRCLAMLFNLRTHIRNFTSNTVFAPIVQTKNLIKFGIESMVGKGLDHKTASLGNHYVIQQKYRDFVQENYNKNKDKISSGDKYNPTVDVIRNNQTIFKTKPLEWLRKTNSRLLEAEDGVALKFHYTRALAQYLAANDIDPANVDPETLSEAEAYAEKEARKATFRDESQLANWLQKASSRSAIAGLVIEGVIPFKKTPINIFNRSVEYSPLGIVGATIDLARMKRGNQDITANDVIDKLASGLTGSLIMGLGAILMHLGVLSGPESDKEKEREWDELQGRQGYSINIGDHSFTLDWLAPSSLPLFVGAQLYEELSQDGASIGEVLESLTNLTDPIVEMSMLQGVQNIIESASYGGDPFTMLGSASMSYASQAVPALGGQIARVFDDTRRENYVEQGSPLSGWQYTAQQVLGKIPGLENTKKEYVNQWGETEDTGSFVERLFSNMLSPSYYKKARSSTVDTEIERLYNATADSAVLPSTGVKSFSASGKEYVLSSQESTAYMKKRGKASYEMLKKLVDSSAYKVMDDEQRAYAVGKIYDYAKDYAQKAVVTGRGEEYAFSSSTEKINAVITEDGNVADYLLFANWNKTFSADKDRRGNAISGSKKKKITEAAEAAGYSRSEIRKYMKLLGYTA